MNKPAPFAAFDIDGTIIRWQLFHAIGDAMAKQEIISTDDYQQVRDARMKWKTRSFDDAFHDYEQVLINVFDKGLKGMPIEEFDALVDGVFEIYHEQVYTYTRDLITQLKQQGYILFAVSGSPHMIVQKFAERYGFDDYAATKYLSENGTYTAEKDISLGKKSELLKNLISKHNASYTQSMAIGDTEGDIAMLEMVEQPIAFNPSKKFFQHAQQQGWKVIVERKNMIYELEASDGSYRLV